MLKPSQIMAVLQLADQGSHSLHLRPKVIPFKSSFCQLSEPEAMSKSCLCTIHAMKSEVLTNFGFQCLPPDNDLEDSLLQWEIAINHQ